MDYSRSQRALVASLCGLGACIADPQEVVENGSGGGSGGGNPGTAELEPLEGTQTDTPVFEVTVQATIDPPYDRELEGDPLQSSVRLFHCGAVVRVDENEVQVPNDTVDVGDVGAVLLVDYDSFGDQELRLGGAGPYNLSLVYDTDGTPVYSESGTWNESGPELGVFPRALESGVPLFELVPGEPHMLTLLDPSAAYDAATQTLTTQYEFQTESGQEHSITESYQFSGRHLLASQSIPWGCD